MSFMLWFSMRINQFWALFKMFKVGNYLQSNKLNNFDHNKIFLKASSLIAFGIFNMLAGLAFAIGNV